MPDKHLIRTGHVARSRPIALALAAIFTAVAVWLVAVTVDSEVLAAAFRAMASHPLQLTIALVAFFAAFAARAVAWTTVLTGLSFGQALAGLHVALGANHILPFRLGEPLRVLSVTRRASIGLGAATASTLTLRAADIVALVTVGVIAGLGRFLDTWVVVPILVLGVVAVVVGVVWLQRLRDEGARRPGLVSIILTLGAWILESVVVLQVADWSGISLTPAEAILVTAAAVVAQIAAIAPGGFGTYEAGGVAALVFLGHDPGVALAVILTSHAVKTAYSLIAGAVGCFVPEPGLMGRLRLPPTMTRPSPAQEPGDGPVVLFMPAHNEEGRVGSVVKRTPMTVLGREVVTLVIDDGSDDATAAEAAAAGAEVISLRPNRGLGGAVRVGLAESLRRDASAVVFCDADGEYAPEELERLVAPILSARADYVVGSRFAGDIHRMLPHRRFGNRVLTILLSWVARRPIDDGQSGYRAFSPQTAAAADIAHDFNYAQVITLDLLQKGFRYVEVPISYSFRSSGDSFVKLGRYLRAVVPAVWRELNHRVPPGSSVLSVLDDVGGESPSGLGPEPVVDIT